MTASVVQTAAVTFAADQTSVPTGNITTTTGHGLLYVICLRTGANFVTGVTDGAGNTWTLLRRQGATSAVAVEVWGTTNANPTGLAGQAITATLSSSDSVVGRWFEIAGANNASLVDVTQGADSTSGTAIATGSSGALAAANELAIGSAGWGGVHTITAPAFTQGSESTSYPSSTGFDDSTGANGQSNLHVGTLTITSTTGQAYTSTLNTAAAWSASVVVLANAAASPPPVPGTITRPRVQQVRSHGEVTGGAPIVGESTYRAQLLNPTTSTEDFVASRSRITRTVAPLNNPPIRPVKTVRVPVQQVVRSTAVVNPTSKALFRLAKLFPANRFQVQPVRPAVQQRVISRSLVTRGLKVQQGQNTFAAKPTRNRPVVQFVRSLTKTLLQPFGPISPPYVPPAGGDGWGDDWDKWNIANPADPNYGDGWE